jgi:outer membrane receptor for ferrienterochelin and colicins
MKLTLKIVSMFLLGFTFVFGQNNENQTNKIQVKGKLIEKTTMLPLELAQIVFTEIKTAKKTIAQTDFNGDFSCMLPKSVYNIDVQYVSLKPIAIKNKNINQDIDLGTLLMLEDFNQLNEVVIVAEQKSVEIKMDKKIYNVGQDLTVKGGTASDVLNNVPSVNVDTDGTVSLRGDDNVRILIDGKISNATNINDVLQTISSDAIDKIEVITNPSARYDAQGGAGILNIILKKGTNKGFNGSIIGTLGTPKNQDVNSSFNFKNDKINLLGNISYNNSITPGYLRTDNYYLDDLGQTTGEIRERETRDRYRENINFGYGADLYLTKSITWSNNIKYRNSDEFRPYKNILYSYQAGNNFVKYRNSNLNSQDSDVKYSSSFKKEFAKKDHVLTIDYNVNLSTNFDDSAINEYIEGETAILDSEYVISNELENSSLIKVDYVLPIKKDSQFEAGYKGEFRDLNTAFEVGSQDALGIKTVNANYTNQLQYKERINAVYSQFGFKTNKLSYLFGLRYEKSDIDVNLFTTQEFNKQNYNNLFPSGFITYELSPKTSFTANYSRRISRPNSRFLNPFSTYTSNVNIFRGDPNLLPSYTNSFDLGYITKFNKVSFTSSIYYKQTQAPIQIVKRISGDEVVYEVNGELVATPVILVGPINLSNQDDIGFEFNLNYPIANWWKINASFNLASRNIKGNYTYTTSTNETISATFDRKSLTYFGKFSSKVKLPYKIDWQTNMLYNGPNKTAQITFKSMYRLDSSISKDIMKSRATISLNVTDIFKSGKRRVQTTIPNELYSDTEIYMRPRQINFSFNYRFKPKKNDREKDGERREGGGEEGGGGF